MAIVPLKNANQIFLLFTKVKGDQLNFYANHFDSLYKRINNDEETNERDSFFMIFNNDKNTIKKNKEEIQSSINFVQKKKLKSPIHKWIIKFVCLLSLLLVCFLGKLLIVNFKFNQIFNRFSYFKDIVFLGMYSGMSSLLISKQITFLTSQNPASEVLIVNQALYSTLISKLNLINFSMHFSKLDETSGDFFVFVEQILNNDSCQFVPNVTKYCNNTLISSGMKNGLRSLSATFQITLQNAKFLFTSKNSLNSDSFFSGKFANDFAEMNVLGFPYFNKFYKFNRILISWS